MRRSAGWMLLLFTAACTGAVPPAPAGPRVASGPGAPALPEWAQQVAADMDPSVSPCVDFYSYACGGWLARERIPAGYDEWDRGHSAVLENIGARLRQALLAPTSSSRDIAAGQEFFAACELGASAVDRTALAGVLARIDEVRDLPGLLRTAGYLHSIGLPVLFSTAPRPERGDVLFVLGPGGTSFPPGVYLGSTAWEQSVAQSYRTYMARLLAVVITPDENAASIAAQVFAFETRLAQAAGRAERADGDAASLPLTRAELQQRTPSLPWPDYFAGLGLPDNVPLGAAAPEYLVGLAEALQESEPAVWRLYLRWQVTFGLSGLLSDTAARAAMDLPIRQALGLSTEPPPRWSRCVGETENAWPEAIDLLTRPESADDSALALDVAPRVAAGLSHAVSTSKWMDASTQAEARRKLAAAGWVVPLPSGARPASPKRSSIAVRNADDFIPLLLDTRRRRAEWTLAHFDLARSGGIGFTRRTSEPLALYQFTSNAVEISPTLLQAPFVDPDLPAPMNFASYGSLIGHELSHSLAGSGRLVDADLAWRDWWTEATLASFQKSGQCLVDLYGAFIIADRTPLTSTPLHVDGIRTLEENLADMGGLAAAYDAFSAWQVENPLEPPALPGLSDDQLFFLSYGQLWCQQMNVGAQLESAFFDTHAPGRFRVNGPLSQFAPFARAFSCSPSAPMVAKLQCSAFAAAPR